MAKKKAKADTKPETVLVLRTCAADGKSSHGFVWPTSGFVEAEDWKPTKECGNGLHGGNNILAESCQKENTGGGGSDNEDDDLLSLLSGDGERTVAVIRAFLDESGTNPETPVICVAGSYGKRDQWKKFKDVWKSHSVGFHALKSSALFGTIVNAMDAAQIESILVSVSKETYKTYASSHFKTALGNAYSACALNCAAQICKYIEPNKGSFVLESGQPNLEFVQHILEYMMNSGEWCISAVAKAKKEDFIELHCADFVSHICSSHDKLWMGRLFELGLLRHAHLTIKDLEDSSAHATMAFQKSKTVRKALKQMQS